MLHVPPTRQASVVRDTNETRIRVSLAIDGEGRSDASTGVGFFDHMLDQLARHSLIDLDVAAEGDTHIDDHHTVEDCGWAIGQALAEALGERRGIRRFGQCALPMDEALTEVAVDVSGRPFLVFDAAFASAKIGTFDTELVREFFQAFAQGARITLHIRNRTGLNAHHIAETCFKGTARALRDACEIDPRRADAVPSTKGTLVA